MSEQDARMIKALVSSCANGETAVKREWSLERLLSLASMPANAKAFLDAGALPILRDVLSGGSEIAKSYSVAALGSIALAGARVCMADEIMVAGIIPKLSSRLTASLPPHEIENAALTLRVIATAHRNCQSACREAGVLEGLRDVLLRDPAVEACQTLTCLSGLCADSEESQAAVLELQPSIIPPIVARLSSGSDIAKGAAARVIFELSRTGEGGYPCLAMQTAFLEGGAAEPLKALLTSPDDALRRSGVAAIHGLLSEDGQTAFQDSICTIIRMAERDAGLLRQYCLECMAELALVATSWTPHPGNQAALLEAGGVELAMGLLSSNDPSLVGSALLALRGMTYEANHDALLASGCIPLLVQLAKCDTRGSTQRDCVYYKRCSKWAFSLIRGLADSDDSGVLQELVSAEAPAAAMHVLQTFTDRKVLRPAAEALGSLQAVMDAAAAEEMLSQVVEMAATCSSHKQAAAVHCLVMVGLESPHLLRDGTMRAAGVTPALMNTLRGGNQRGKSEACALLSRLAGFDDGPAVCREIVEADDGVVLLTRLLEEGFFQARQGAAEVLGCLAMRGHTAAVLEVEGCIPALVGLLAGVTKKDVENAEEEAACALRCLALSGEEAQRVILQAGGIEALVGLA